MVQPWFDVDTVESGTAPPIDDLAAETRRRLAAPLGSAPLRELAAAAVKRAAPREPKAVIAVTDLTRASPDAVLVPPLIRSEEHTSESSHRCISYAVFCLKKK